MFDLNIVEAILDFVAVTFGVILAVVVTDYWQQKSQIEQDRALLTRVVLELEDNMQLLDQAQGRAGLLEDRLQPMAFGASDEFIQQIYAEREANYLGLADFLEALSTASYDVTLVSGTSQRLPVEIFIPLATAYERHTQLMAGYRTVTESLSFQPDYNDDREFLTRLYYGGVNTRRRIQRARDTNADAQELLRAYIDELENAKPKLRLQFGAAPAAAPTKLAGTFAPA